MAASEQLIVISSSGGITRSDRIIDQALFQLLEIEPPKDDADALRIIKNSPSIFTTDQKVIERHWIVSNIQRFRKVVRALTGERAYPNIPGLAVLGPDDAEKQGLRSVDGSITLDVVYCRHPLDPSLLVPMAAFHDYLLQEKRSEFVRLAVALGAKSIKLVSSEKTASSSKFDAEVAIPVDGADVDLGAKGGHRSSTSEGFSLDSDFSAPRRSPFLPDGLLWFNREPIWKSMAFARQESWASTYNVSLSYTQDFGITADLAAKVAGFGLNAGGSFSSMKAIHQTYRVDFFSRDEFATSTEQAGS